MYAFIISLRWDAPLKQGKGTVNYNVTFDSTAPHPRHARHGCTSPSRGQRPSRLWLLGPTCNWAGENFKGIFWSSIPRLEWAEWQHTTSHASRNSSPRIAKGDTIRNENGAPQRTTCCEKGATPQGRPGVSRPKHHRMQSPSYPTSSQWGMQLTPQEVNSRERRGLPYASEVGDKSVPPVAN